MNQLKESVLFKNDNFTPTIIIHVMVFIEEL